jgi:hypothetical protein
MLQACSIINVHIYIIFQEVTESQNRKLQTEVATLQTENRLLKDKYNRAQGMILSNIISVHLQIL